MNDLPTLADVEAAADRLAGVVHRTPLDESTTFAAMCDAETVHLKLETMQWTGAFKPRGAYNAMAQLSARARENGVVTVSAGNHAQGVAWAARELGLDAWVVMPEATPAVKVAATRGYGATVDLHGTTYQELRDRAAELEVGRDLTFVHPFDDPHVVAGQGTVGLEIVDDLAGVDTVVTALGGGGLLSGVATAVTGANPDTRVVGVETPGSTHAAASLEAGEVVVRDHVDTIAEGISPGRLGETTLGVLEERVDELVTVDEARVTAAVALLAERANVVAESAGAVPLAAVLSDDLDVTGERVALVVSGGNVGLREHAHLARRGLAALDRYLDLRVAVTGWPDGLTALVETVESADGEIDDLSRSSPAGDVPPNRHAVSLGVEVTGPAHAERVRAAIDGARGLERLD